MTFDAQRGYFGWKFEGSHLASGRLGDSNELNRRRSLEKDGYHGCDCEGTVAADSAAGAGRFAVDAGAGAVRAGASEPAIAGGLTDFLLRGRFGLVETTGRNGRRRS